MFRKCRIFLCLWMLAAGFAPVAGQSPQDNFSRFFKTFKDVAPGVAFFAPDPGEVRPFEQPLSEARGRLEGFLGKDLAPGAIVLCTTLDQRDSVNETRVLKMGYKWVLIQLTPEASRQQMLAQIRSRTGGQLPPGIQERIQNQPPEIKKMTERRLISATVQRYATAVLMTTLAPDRPYRSSRLEDSGRSPLSDWLDVGIAAYAAGSSSANLRFLQERLDEAFPLEDVLTMARPFVAPSSGSSAGGEGGIIIRMAPGPGSGPAPSVPPGASVTAPAAGFGAAGMGRPMNLPKDVQDRMSFDAQAASFFLFLVQRVGVEKVREMVQWNLGGKDVREYPGQREILGSDLEKLEREWHDWIKKTETDPPGIRIMESGSRPSAQPE